MTVALAWVRRIRDCEELVFASDSRLSGDGRLFDGCPKILTLPRSDCAICFAGDTGNAYPVMIQLALAIDSHAPARRGSLDIVSLKTHALKIFNGMAGLLKDSPHVTGTRPTLKPNITFIFGGYSWIKKQFHLWTITYKDAEKTFIAQPAKWACYSEKSEQCVTRRRSDLEETHYFGKIAFAGDQSPLAKQLLFERLDEEHKRSRKPVRLDLQPLMVVRDMLRNYPHLETIGGAPQVVKVYQYMNTAPLGVYWPNKASGQVTLLGRLCLGYERIDRWILDPDTGVSESPIYSRNDVDEIEGEDDAEQAITADAAPAAHTT